MANGHTMRKVSLRNILAHKLRLALTLLAVVLGTAFIAGSFMFTNSLSNTFDAAVSNAFTDVDAAVSPGEGAEAITEDQITALREDDKVARVNIRDSNQVVVADSDAKAFQTGAGTSSLVPWYPGDDYVGGTRELVDGEAPEGETSVVINKAAATKYEIAVGDEIIVVFPGSQERMTVAGIQSQGADEGTGIELAMAVPDYLERFGEPRQVVVQAAEGVTAAELVDHIEADYDLSAESGEKLAADISELVTESLKFINYFLVAFGLIALLVGTFIIANTFAMIVAQRTKEFALLRALGASRGQITNSVLVESFIVGLVGSAVGVVGGMGLVAIIKAVMAAQNMDLGSGLGLSPMAIAVPIGLGTVVTMVSAWAPARRAGMVEPVEAMRSTEQAAGSPLMGRTIAGAVLLALGAALAVIAVLIDASTSNRAITVGVGALALIIGLILAGPALSLPIVPTLGRIIGLPFGAVGRLAATNSKRNPRRTAATAFALMLGVALVTAIGMLGATMKTAVSDQIEQDFKADFVLRGPQGGGFVMPRETGEYAAKADGVAEVFTFSMGPLEIDGEASQSFGGVVKVTSVVDGNPDRVLNLDITAGDADFSGPAFMADSELAAEKNWQVGQQYEVATPDPVVPTAQATLVGTYEPNDTAGKLMISRPAAMEVLAGQELDPQMIAVIGEEGIDEADLRTNLQEAVKELIIVQVVSAQEYADESVNLINQMLSILYGLLALAVIIAILGIVNTLTLGVIERRQEIGMLRAVGTYRAQIRRMITLEAVQIAIFGALTGMLLGLGLGWAFIEVISGEGLGSATIPWAQLAIMLAGSALVGILAALWPASRAAKVPPLDAIAD